MKVESAELFLTKSVEGRLESSGIEEVGGAWRLMLAMSGPPFLTPALVMPLFAPGPGFVKGRGRRGAALRLRSCRRGSALRLVRAGLVVDPPLALSGCVATPRDRGQSLLVLPASRRATRRGYSLWPPRLDVLRRTECLAAGDEAIVAREIIKELP